MCNPACIAFGEKQLRREDVAGKDVLDVGSFDVNGSLRDFVEAHGPKRYVGVDVRPGPGVDEICPAERLVERFGPESFDVVLATEVLEHIADWRAAIRSMKAVLRPDGVALLTTPSPGFPYHGYPDDYWRFEPELLESAFADFEVEALEHGSAMLGVFLAARKRANGTPVDLSELDAVPVAKPTRRAQAFAAVWRTATRTLARLPVSLRSPRQLARESLAAGAIQKVPELARLIALVKARRPHAVVEIGSFLGGTLAAWCKLAAPDAVLVSVDLPDESETPAKPDDLRRLALARQRLEVVRNDSHAEETRREVEAALAGSEVDFLMIDADHSYDGVRRDFELYAPLVRDGGLVAFHDIVPHTRLANIEVSRFWTEVRARYEHEEFISAGRDRGFGEWGGIGVLRYQRELLSR
jgi:predicted O-methyltransferase YrrM